MAISSDTFTGNGSTKTYSFTFPYLATTDIKIKLTTAAGVDKDITAYTLPSATSITFTALGGSATDWQETTGAPKSTVTILIYRDTDSSSLPSTFYPGSAIRSTDLNDNFTQNLYVTQEAEVDVATANTTADTAKAAADDAADDVKRWIKDGDGADTAGDEDDAVFANRPLRPQGVPYAVTKSNTAIADSTTALGKANTAIQDSAAAVITANAASAAVDTVMPHTIVANKAALPANADQDDIFEVTDSTDLEDLGGGSDIIWVNAAGSTSGQDIAALKPNVTWDSGITLRMKKYGTSTSDRKYIFQSYYANDPESKYVRAAAATFTENVILDNAKEVRLSEADSNGAAYVGLKGPTDMGAASSYTVTLPSATPTANQILKADASTPTTLTWASAAASTAGATFTGGVNLADGIKLTLGDGAGADYNPGSFEIYENTDLYIKSNGGHIRNNVPAAASVLLEGPTGSLAKFIEGGACELYYDDDKALITTDSGITLTANNSSLPGLSAHLNLGNSNNCRIEVYDNNAANSAINNNTFKIYSQHGGNNTTKTSLLYDGFFDQVWRTSGSSDGPSAELGRVNYDGGWEFYYHDIQGNQGNSWSGSTSTKKFETTSSGVKVTGTAVPASITALSSSSNSTAVDLSANNNFSLTLAENSTLAQPTNQTVGQSGSIFVTQDGTGSRTLGYHADWKWAGGSGSQPTVTADANAVSRIDYIVMAANKIHAVASLDVK